MAVYVGVTGISGLWVSHPDAWEDPGGSRKYKLKCGTKYYYYYHGFKKLIWDPLSISAGGFGNAFENTSENLSNLLTISAEALEK